MFSMVSEGALLRQALAGNRVGIWQGCILSSVYSHLCCISDWSFMKISTKSSVFLTASLEFNDVSDLALLLLSTLA
jgi:hypothetical protein